MKDEDKSKEKEVGGFKLPNGITMGPFYFSPDGGKAANIMGPAIIAFEYGIANTLNRLKDKDSLPIDEFQSNFNATVEDLVSEVLIYFQNRLATIVKGKPGEFNSVDTCIKAYNKESINLSGICDTEFLVSLGRVRGRKHHSARRYDADYQVGDVSYDTVPKLRDLIRKVKEEIRKVNEALDKSHKEYNIEVKQEPGVISATFMMTGHAIDLTRGGRVVPIKPKEEKKTKFILHGGFTPGNTNENNTDFYSEILKDVPVKAKVLLVLFAKNDDRWQIAEGRLKTEFERVKGQRDLSFEVAQEGKFAEQLKSVDVIYFSGGSSKKALDVLKKLPPFGREFVGKTIAGESGGANVLTQFFYSPSADEVFEGLGILPVKMIPHFTQEKASKLDSVGVGLEEVFLPEYTHRIFISNST